MTTVDDLINQAKAEVLARFPRPILPDFGLDADVRRYNQEVEVIHRALASAEETARATYLKTVKAPPKTKKGQ